VSFSFMTITRSSFRILISAAVKLQNTQRAATSVVG